MGRATDDARVGKVRRQTQLGGWNEMPVEWMRRSRHGHYEYAPTFGVGIKHNSRGNFRRYSRKRQSVFNNAGVMP